MTTLGDEVKLISMIGNDSTGVIVKSSLRESGSDTSYISEVSCHLN